MFSFEYIWLSNEYKAVCSNVCEISSVLFHFFLLAFLLIIRRNRQFFSKEVYAHLLLILILFMLESFKPIFRPFIKLS